MHTLSNALTTLRNAQMRGHSLTHVPMWVVYVPALSSEDRLTPAPRGSMMHFLSGFLFKNGRSFRDRWFEPQFDRPTCDIVYVSK